MDIVTLMQGKPAEPKPENHTSHSPQWQFHGSHMVSRLPLPTVFKLYYSDILAAEPAETPKISVAAFDMDETLITTKSGTKFGRGPRDWKWRTNEILPVLKKRVESEKKVLVIFTNQSTVTVTEERALLSISYRNLTLKIGLMAVSLEAQLGNMPVLFFASTGKPRKSVVPRSSDELHVRYRKPKSGMWDELERYLRRCLGLHYSIDLAHSYYVGDAAGRDGDHLDADKGFAANAGVRFYVPEEYFGA